MENEEKPNWKQWIPIYGIYQAAKDALNGEPSVMTTNHSGRYIGSAAYHGITTTVSLIYGLEKLCQ